MNGVTPVAKTVVLSFRLTEDQYRITKQMAAEKDMDISTFVRMAISEYIHNHFLMENDQKEEETD